ncbi:MAG: hypothetical protein RLZZ557_1449, partial [Bacteroidota bacterium]
MNRRNFIATGSMAAGSLLWQPPVFAAEGAKRLTILHTNDVHSRLDP